MSGPIMEIMPGQRENGRILGIRENQQSPSGTANLTVNSGVSIISLIYEQGASTSRSSGQVID